MGKFWRTRGNSAGEAFVATRPCEGGGFRGASTRIVDAADQSADATGSPAVRELGMRVATASRSIDTRTAWG
jgi:hypothetical protein